MEGQKCTRHQIWGDEREKQSSTCWPPPCASHCTSQGPQQCPPGGWGHGAAHQRCWRLTTLALWEQEDVVNREITRISEALVPCVNPNNSIHDYQHMLTVMGHWVWISTNLYALFHSISHSSNLDFSTESAFLSEYDMQMFILQYLEDFNSHSFPFPLL